MPRPSEFKDPEYDRRLEEYKRMKAEALKKRQMQTQSSSGSRNFKE